MMANWRMPCMFSGDLGTLSPRLHDLMTNMTYQNAKCVHLLYIREATICSLLWSYKQVHLLSYLTFLLSVRAHIKVYHGVMLRRKIKLPSYYRPGRPCVIPTLPFKITAFFLWVCECILFLCDKAWWKSFGIYCIMNFIPVSFHWK